MIFEIKSIYGEVRWSGEAIDRRAAILAAIKSGSNLSGSDLSGSNLRGSNLSGSDLSGSNLRGSREDFFTVLAKAPKEVPGLIAALREGRIDGQAYEGPCACLVGTIANVRGVSYDSLIDLRPDSSRPAERWFLAINEGDTPANSQIVAITVEWAEKWLRDQGLPVPPHVAVYWRGDVAALAVDLRAAGVDVAALAGAIEAPKEGST